MAISFNPLQGRRIFVLSLQGETLQVYTLPVRPQIEGPIFHGTLCCFDGKLLAPVRDGRVWQGITVKEVVALCGV